MCTWKSCLSIHTDYIDIHEYLPLSDGKKSIWPLWVIIMPSHRVYRPLVVRCGNKPFGVRFTRFSLLHFCTLVIRLYLMSVTLFNWNVYSRSRVKGQRFYKPG